jgi:hypothetical protein
VVGSGRLRGLVALVAATTAAIPPLGVAFFLPALRGNGVPLNLRIDEGRILGLVLLVALAGLLAVGFVLLRLERRIRWSPARSRGAWRAIGALGGLFLLIVVINLAASERGLTGSISHQVRQFTTTAKDPLSDPAHLVSTNSGNRWVWWQEALGAFSDRPLQGWGAGSFPVTHLQYREEELSVRQPHNVPLQFLAETGLVGALLWIGAIVLLLLAGVWRVRTLRPGRERDLAGALLAAGIAWTIHTLYDWDWDIPGATLPALILLGVLAARPPREGHGHGLAAAFEVPRPPRQRPLHLAAVALLLTAFAMSALLPAWSHGKAIDALGLAGGRQVTPTQLEKAAAQAELAARLNPLSVEPLFAAHTIAVRRERLGDARRYLLQAVDRQPQNRVAWFRLALLAAETRNPAGFLRAALKALRLDPQSGIVRALAQRALAFAAPPNDSASATGTPLPSLIATPDAAPAPADAGG